MRIHCAMLIKSRHFKRDQIICLKYHGRERKSLTEKDIVSADLVLTTYHTLVSEFDKGKKTLFDTHWYRLVLDEGKKQGLL